MEEKEFMTPNQAYKVQNIYKFPSIRRIDGLKMVILV